MRLFVAISAMLLIVGCYGRTDEPMLDARLPEATTTIAQLRSYASSHQATAIPERVIVRGRITSSDRSGNFYRSMTVEDATGGLELLVGEYNLDALYPEGLEVALRLEGCAMQYRYGVVQVGVLAASYESFGVGDIESRQRIDEVVVRGIDVEPVEPRRRMVGKLGEDDCGRLVRVDSLCLIASTSIDTLLGESLDLAIWERYSMFRDSRGDTLVVYTSEYADYATTTMSCDSLSITGIVQYGSYPKMGSYYQIKMRYAEDCTLY